MKRVSTFATRLKELRTARGLSMHGLEEETGINHVSISRWEQKKQSPNIESVATLAEYFKVTVGYLAGYDEN